MIFNEELCYFLTPNNRYGIQKKSIKHITEDDYTFYTQFKVDFNAQKETGAVLCKSGMHNGIFVFNDESNLFVQGIVWIIDNNSPTPVEVTLKVPKELQNQKLTVKLLLDNKNKSIKLITNWNEISKKFYGDLVDYSQSWVWLGCGNAHTSNVTHQNYFYGEIFHASIYDKLIKNDVDLIPENSVVFTDLKEYTYYKIKDLSENGNHFTNYNKEWFDDV